MAAGKTTVGRQLARLLGLSFIDCDQKIEDRTGTTISIIFEIEGEEGFRQREAALLDELTQIDGVVLATGGGAVLRRENRTLLRERGVVVYLSASIETQWKRTRGKTNRPLLETADPRKTLEELASIREPLYQEVADISIEADGRSSAAMAKHIAGLLGLNGKD